MMKITGLSHLFKWENLHNWWLTKYFFAPLYMSFKYYIYIIILDKSAKVQTSYERSHIFILHYHVTLVWVMRTDQSNFGNYGSIINKDQQSKISGKVSYKYCCVCLQ